MPRTNKQTGDTGELTIARMIKCPNCKRELRPLPPNYVLFDVQCSGCVFRAQVKTNRCAPKEVIFGAGYSVLKHYLRTGHMIPPLIVNFEWKARGRRRHEIRFYPFLAESHVRRRRLPSGYVMFNYHLHGALMSVLYQDNIGGVAGRLSK